MKGPDNRLAFHAPLKKGDALAETVGCRHTNPDICARHSLPNVCAFVREDGICKSPPGSWPKQYERLRTGTAAASPTPARTRRARGR